MSITGPTAAAHPQALLLDAQPTTTQLTQLQATVHAAAADALPAWLRACVHAELVHAPEDADTVELLALADLQIAAP